MAALDYTWNLIGQIEKLSMSDELREEIKLFIEQHKVDNGVYMPVSNIIFRGNLHYIIDHITAPGLLEELKNNRKIV